MCKHQIDWELERGCLGDGAINIHGKCTNCQAEFLKTLYPSEVDWEYPRCCDCGQLHDSDKEYTEPTWCKECNQKNGLPKEAV